MKLLRLAALACTGEGGVAASLKRATRLIEEACHGSTDLICLPEMFAWTTLEPAAKQAAAEPLGGPFSRAVGALAVKHKVNILSPLLELDQNKMFNTMAWFNRCGRIIGVYRKVFPTTYEMEQGFEPGSLDFSTHQTEFGPIGCCICFDLNFPEVINRIAEQGATLVIHPTMFDGIALMRAWAKLQRMYFVSVAGDPYGSLVDPLGKPLIESWRYPRILSTAINLDFVVLHSDENKDKLPAVKRELGDAVHIDWRYIEGAVLLESRHPEWSAMRIVKHFELELEGELFDRTRKERRRRLNHHVQNPGGERDGSATGRNRAS